jgi:hypothetical protein
MLVLENADKVEMRGDEWHAGRRNAMKECRLDVDAEEWS